MITDLRFKLLKAMYLMYLTDTGFFFMYLG